MSTTRTLPIFEFPEWLGAITVRELRAGLMGRDLVFLLIVTQVGLAFAGIYAIEWSATTPREAAQMLRGVTYAAAAIGLLLHAPIRALRGLHTDRDSGLLALLQITPQTSGRIVFGKWLSGAIQSALYLATLLPYFVLRFFVGGADIVSESQLLFGVFALSLVLQASGLLLSTLPRILRVFALIGLVLGMFVLVANLLARTFSPYGAVRPTYPGVLFALVAAGLLVPLLLSAAAQSIAAPAENYVARFRLVLAAAIAALGAYVIYAAPLTGKWSDAVVIFSGYSIGLASFFEFAAPGGFLPAQVPRWLGRVPLPGLWVRFLLPGWRSAAYFYPLLLIAVFGYALAAGPSGVILSVFTQAGALILLPRVLLEGFNVQSRRTGLVLMVWMHGAALFLALVIVAVFSLTLTHPIWPEFVPGLGFWVGLMWGDQGWWFAPPLAWILGLTLVLVLRGREELGRASAVARSLRAKR